MRQLFIFGMTILVLAGVFVSLAAAGSVTSKTQGRGNDVARETTQASSTANSFLTNLKEGDYSGAYALLAPNLKREFESPDSLATILQVPGAKPEQWSFHSTTMSDGSGALEGTLTYADEHRGSVELRVHRIGTQWQVTEFWFR